MARVKTRGVTNQGPVPPAMTAGTAPGASGRHYDRTCRAYRMRAKAKYKAVSAM